jgi:hypothetical protein
LPEEEDDCVTWYMPLPYDALDKVAVQEFTASVPPAVVRAGVAELAMFTGGNTRTCTCKGLAE